MSHSPTPITDASVHCAVDWARAAVAHVLRLMTCVVGVTYSIQLGSYRVLIDVAGMTDRGKVQKHNADQLLIAELNKSVLIRSTTLPIVQQRKLAATTVGYLLLVADGCSDSADTDRAGDAAVTTVEFVLALLPWFFDAVRRTGEASEKLARFVANASRPLHPLADLHDRADCQSTITMAFLIGPTLFTVHRGSSRLYLLRGDELHHVTVDSTRGNTRGATKVRSAQISGDTDDSRQVTSVVATPPKLRTHVHHATIAHGDVVMLCTDGLTQGVTDEELASLLRERRPPDTTCLMLIQAANRAGGLDNTSVIVAHALDQL